MLYHAIFALLWPFIHHNALKGHPFCWKWQDLLLSLGWKCFIIYQWHELLRNTCLETKKPYHFSWKCFSICQFANTRRITSFCCFNMFLLTVLCHSGGHFIFHMVWSTRMVLEVKLCLVFFCMEHNVNFPFKWKKKKNPLTEKKKIVAPEKEVKHVYSCLTQFRVLYQKIP